MTKLRSILTGLTLGAALLALIGLPIPVRSQTLGISQAQSIPSITLSATTNQLTMGASAHKLIISSTAPAGASQTLTFPDPTGSDSVAYLALAQAFTNKTLTAPVFGGTITGTYTLGGTPTISAPTMTAPVLGVATGTSLAVTGLLTSSSASAGIGYATGAGCAIGQASTRTSTVICTGLSGAITLVSAAGTTAVQSFTVTDTSVAVTDVVHVAQKSGTDLYEIFVTNVGSGSFKITYFTTGGTTTEQPVFNFVVIKGVAS